MKLPTTNPLLKANVKITLKETRTTEGGKVQRTTAERNNREKWQRCSFTIDV